MPNTHFTDSTTLSLDWINDPPVRELEAREIEPSCTWLLNQLQDWKQPEVPPEYEESATRWNRRLEDGADRADVMAVYGNFDAWIVYAYFFSGKPVAIMAIDKDEFTKCSVVYISDITCHPGARNGGDILIEYATNLSQEMGYSGKLKLSAVPGSCDFYRSVGFNINGSICELDPANSDLWEMRDQKWKLKAVWQVRSNESALVSYEGLRFRN